MGATRASGERSLSKVLPPSFAKDEERLRRFEQEAKAAGALNHPNLLTVLDVGRADDAPYLVSELLEGTTLRALLSGSSLTQRKARLWKELQPAEVAGVAQFMVVLPTPDGSGYAYSFRRLVGDLYPVEGLE